MKINILLKSIFIVPCLLTVLLSHAQPTTSLIAHWDMNGTTNDVSGFWHNGHGNNLTPAAGIDGVPGHAWYFNGVNSSITIPYAPDLNVSAYTISATIKVMGFYSGVCHGNILFCRGTSGGGANGTYLLDITDYPAGYGCSSPTVDSTEESFVAEACGTGSCLGPSSFTPFNVTPYIVKNTWYTVVATFNDSVFKIYINNVLKATVPITTPGVPMGISTDSASIGYCIYDAAAGYPYGFNGIIDDIRLYNRALNDTEIIHLNPTLGTNAITADDMVSVYPNPVKNTFSVQQPYTMGTMQLFNNVGQLVAEKKIDKEIMEFDITSAPAGIYALKILSEGNLIYKKVIKY